MKRFIYIANLAHLIIKYISHPTAAGETFLASDVVDLSTPYLIRKIGSYMIPSTRLIPVPARLLEWNPPVSQEAGLEKTVAWFLDNV